MVYPRSELYPRCCAASGITVDDESEGSNRKQESAARGESLRCGPSVRPVVAASGAYKFFRGSALPRVTCYDGRLLAVTQSVYDQCKCRRRLPPARIIKVVARKDIAPIVKHAHEAAFSNMFLRNLFQREG